MINAPAIKIDGDKKRASGLLTYARELFNRVARGSLNPHNFVRDVFSDGSSIEVTVYYNKAYDLKYGFIRIYGVGGGGVKEEFIVRIGMYDFSLNYFQHDHPEKPKVDYIIEDRVNYIGKSLISTFTAAYKWRSLKTNESVTWTRGTGSRIFNGVDKVNIPAPFNDIEAGSIKGALFFFTRTSVFDTIYVYSTSKQLLLYRLKLPSLIFFNNPSYPSFKIVEFLNVHNKVLIKEITSVIGSVISTKYHTFDFKFVKPEYLGSTIDVALDYTPTELISYDSDNGVTTVSGSDGFPPGGFPPSEDSSRLFMEYNYSQITTPGETSTITTSLDSLIRDTQLSTGYIESSTGANEITSDFIIPNAYIYPTAGASSTNKSKASSKSNTYSFLDPSTNTWKIEETLSSSFSFNSSSSGSSSTTYTPVGTAGIDFPIGSPQPYRVDSSSSSGSSLSENSISNGAFILRVRKYKEGSLNKYGLFFLTINSEYTLSRSASSEVVYYEAPGIGRVYTTNSNTGGQGTIYNTSVSANFNGLKIEILPSIGNHRVTLITPQVIEDDVFIIYCFTIKRELISTTQLTTQGLTYLPRVLSTSYENKSFIFDTSHSILKYKEYNYRLDRGTSSTVGQPLSYITLKKTKEK